MIDSRVIGWHEMPYGEYQLGYCAVEMGGKAAFYLKVCKSKAGHLYCAFPTFKIKDRWEPYFSFMNKDFEKKFLNQCMEQLRPLIQPPVNDHDSGYPNMDEPEQSQGVPF